MLGFSALGKQALGKAPSATAEAVTAEAGAFVLTGQAALFSISVPLDVGVFSLAGQAATQPVSMPAGTGAFTLTGQDAATAAAFSILCLPSTAGDEIQWGFAALGKAAFGQGRKTRGSSITFAVTGQDVGFSAAIVAQTGVFTVTGQAANLVEGYVLTAERGAFVLGGQPAGLRITTPLATGSFVVSVQGQLIDFTRRVPKLRRFPRVGSTTVSARSRGAGVKVRAYGG